MLHEFVRRPLGPACISDYDRSMKIFIPNNTLTVAKRLLAIVMLVVVSGCYMPIRFDAEIDINRRGEYSFIFDGYLAKVQLYQDIQAGEVSREEELKQVSLIKDDFERVSAVSDFKYYEKAHFHINYDRSGNLIKAKTMTFFRRNEYILGISYNKNTGQISMLGKSLASDVKARLRASGLDTSGELRIFSNGVVVSHNATTVKPFEKRGPGYKMYTWKIANLLSPTPAFKIQVHSPRQ